MNFVNISRYSAPVSLFILIVKQHNTKFNFQQEGVHSSCQGERNEINKPVTRLTRFTGSGESAESRNTDDKKQLAEVADINHPSVRVMSSTVLMDDGCQCINTEEVHTTSAYVTIFSRVHV